MNKKTIGSFMLLFATIIWGLSYSVQTLADELGTFTIVAFKSFGGFILLLIALINKRKFDKKAVQKGFLIGIIVCAAIVLQQKGLELSSAANASFLTVLYIIFTPLIGLFIGRKPEKKIWIAIPIALIGMYLLCVNGAFELRIGDILLIIASILFALQIILIDKYIQEVDALVFAGMQQATCSVIAGTIAFFTNRPSLTVIGNYLPYILYMAVMSGAVTQFIQNRFQRDVEPSLASIIMSLESVFGALFGWIILNQALTIKEIFGCVLIFIAILIAE